MVPVPSDLMRNTVAWGGQSEGENGCLVLELPAPIALPRLGFEPCKATVALCDQRGQPTGNHRGPRCSDSDCFFPGWYCSSDLQDSVSGLSVQKMSFCIWECLFKNTLSSGYGYWAWWTHPRWEILLLLLSFPTATPFPIPRYSF